MVFFFFFEISSESMLCKIVFSQSDGHQMSTSVIYGTRSESHEGLVSCVATQPSITSKATTCFSFVSERKGKI